VTRGATIRGAMIRGAMIRGAIEPDESGAGAPKLHA
jgi:hypothetical protein